MHGTAGGVGKSSSVDRLSDVPEFRQVRHRRKSFARVPRREILRTPLVLSSPKFDGETSFLRGDPCCMLRPDDRNPAEGGGLPMRKVVASEFVSLDGVVESPEQWQLPYFNDEMGQEIEAAMAQADAMLLGRVTYEEWAAFFPSQSSEDMPSADYMNNTPSS
jgi:hypothetical protein